MVGLVCYGGVLSATGLDLWYNGWFTDRKGQRPACNAISDPREERSP